MAQGGGRGQGWREHSSTWAHPVWGAEVQLAPHPVTACLPSDILSGACCFPRPLPLAVSTQRTSPAAAFLAGCMDTIGLNLQENTGR